MTETSVPLTALSEAQRAQANIRFMIIRPALEEGVSQAQAARTYNVPASTIRRWVKRYREKGIAGLADAGRSDKGKPHRLSPDAISLIESLAFQTPPRSVAAIHRRVTAIAQEQGWNPPSYARVRQIIKNLKIARQAGTSKAQEKTTKLTMQDIATLAGVSKATVSRVLNDKPDVDAATREHILRIIDEQGFIPSIAASGLAGGRRQLIGMLIPSFVWPLIPELMRGVADMLEETSYELVLYCINEGDSKRDRSEVINRVLATQLTAGLLAVFPGPASRDLTRLYHQGFPVVVVDDQSEQEVPWVSVDNVTGAYMATQHLIKLGHRRIAHIAGPPEYKASHDRYDGYRKALLEAGIPLDPTLVLEGDFLPPSGRACATRLFQLPQEQRPTAIFAATDQMCYGVLAAADEFGLVIPRDVALVGFDDDVPSVHVHPPLTTVRQPYFEMGVEGLKLLLSLLDAREKGPSARFARKASSAKDSQSEPIRIQLATTLVVRASCGADYQITVPETVES
jgi:LacI family transcriptional regulator